MKPRDYYIQEALERGEDATGLLTVRDACWYLIRHRGDNMELWFNENGKRVTVELLVTKVIDSPQRMAFCGEFTHKD